MYSVKGSFKDGVAQPDEPVHGHDGQPVLITFLDDSQMVDDLQMPDNFPSVEEVVARIKALGLSKSYIPPTKSLRDLLASATDDEPIDSAEWDRQWAKIEAEMKQRDLDNDRAEGLI